MCLFWLEQCQNESRSVFILMKTIAEFTVFAFWDNLSAENLNFSADFSIQLIQFLECMIEVEINEQNRMEQIIRDDPIILTPAFASRLSKLWSSKERGRGAQICIERWPKDIFILNVIMWKGLRIKSTIMSCCASSRASKIAIQRERDISYAAKILLNGFVDLFFVIYYFIYPTTM